MIAIGIDSNILIYFAQLARGSEDEPKIEYVRTLISRLTRAGRVCAPVQAIGELYAVLARSHFGRDRARDDAVNASALFAPIHANPTSFAAALDLATTHKLQFWDALIVSTAADAGCAMLISEDMQHGFAWRGVTVVDPFCQDGRERLAAIF